MDHSGCSFEIKISYPKLSTSRDEGSLKQEKIFYDGDTIEGVVIMNISELSYTKYIGIELVGKAKLRIEKQDNVLIGPNSFKFKELFLKKNQTLVGTAPVSTKDLDDFKIIQLNCGKHSFPFKIILEPGSTPGKLKWDNFNNSSFLDHHVECIIYYQLAYVFEKKKLINFSKKYYCLQFQR